MKTSNIQETRFKALSLWQPWATLMATGAKTIETRSWETSYRGPLVICASKRWRKREMEELLEIPAYREALEPELEDGLLQVGVAVAVVHLVECLRAETIMAFGSFPEEVFGNYAPGRYGWITDMRRGVRVDPWPVVGRQGLFEVEVPQSAAEKYRQNLMEMEGL